MLEDIPGYIGFIFALTTGITIAWFYFASNKSKVFLWLAIIWTGIQVGLGLSGFYTQLDAMPPRLMMAVALTLILIIGIFFSTSGKKFIDQLNLRTLTFLSVIRIPVEIVLDLLYKEGYLSRTQTFEGTNFDIIAGISAPIIGLIAFRKGGVNKPLAWIWNIVCLALLLNIVITSILAFPFPFQVIAYDQPGLAMLYLPFNLLPTVVVPIVMFSHFAAFRKLLKMR